MYDGPEEGEGDEENVQEGSGQGVRAGALQEVLGQWNREVGMQVQAEEGLSEDRGAGLQGRSGLGEVITVSSRDLRRRINFHFRGHRYHLSLKQMQQLSGQRE